MNWLGRTAVITGASSGIGEATARQFAAKGLRVILVARRVERLSALKREIESGGGQASVVEADLSVEAKRQSVFEAVQSLGGADVLVNNAGFGWYGYFSQMPWTIAHKMLRVNVEAIAHLTSLFLPGMYARRQGHIINVGSISGSLPSQGISIYCATKAFEDAFTTALYRETRGSGVEVSVVRAGPVLTEFGETALCQPNGGHVPTERIGVSADQVARRIWGLLLRPRRVIHVPRWLALAPWAELAFGWLEDMLGPLLLRRVGKND